MSIAESPLASAVAAAAEHGGNGPPLQGLDAAAAHAATNPDAADTVDLTEEQLIDLGLLVVLAKQPDTALITCRKRRESSCRKANPEEAMAW